MAGALKARVGGAWTYVKGIKGDTGPAGPPSVGLTTLTSNYDQTIRQVGPTSPQLLFRQNKEAHLNDRNDVDATGATDMGATITTYLSEFAAAGTRRIYFDEGSKYTTSTTIDVPGNMWLMGGERISDDVQFTASTTGVTIMRLSGGATTVQGMQFRLLNMAGVVGLNPNQHNQSVRHCHFLQPAADGAGIKGGQILYFTVTDCLFNAIVGYGMDLLNSYGTLGGYYGVNVGQVERCQFYSNGGVTAIRLHGIFIIRDCDIEGAFTGPCVWSHADGANSFGQVQNTYFELNGGANQGILFDAGKAIARDNDMYGQDGTAGSYAIKASVYVVDISGNFITRFETGIIANSPASGSVFGVGRNYITAATTTIAGAPATRQNGFAFPQAAGTIMDRTKGFRVTGAAIVGMIIQASSPTTDNVLQLGQANTFHLAYTGATTVTVAGAVYGMQCTLYFANANATLQTSVWNLISGIDETPPAGTTKTFIVDYNQVLREVGPRRVRAAGSAPAIAAGTGAGTSPTVSVSGADSAGTITVTTGTSPAASATVATVTFNASYGAAPKSVLIDPCGVNSAALTGTGRVYEDQASRTATTFALKVGSTALAASTTYTFAYQVIG